MIHLELEYLFNKPRYLLFAKKIGHFYQTSLERMNVFPKIDNSNHLTVKSGFLLILMTLLVSCGHSLKRT